MLWVGGVLTLAVVVWPLAPDLRRGAFLRFSRIAVFLIAALLAAGTFVSIQRLPELSDLWTTSYGKTLLVKIGLVCVALAWGGFHHTFVRPRLERGETPPGVGRSLLGESVVALAVLFAAAVLVDAGPLAFGAVLVAISGGAGFLGLHLARRLVADGHAVRTLDLAPLDDAPIEGRVEELHGDVRLTADARRLARGADVLVHAAAALPIQESRAAIRSVNVEGAAVTFAAAAEAGVRRLVLVSSTAVYGVPERHPIHEDDPLVGVGHYGESKIDAERLCEAFARRGLETVIVRPKTFVGPERLGVFEILFDWIREDRRIPILGDGANRYQLLAVEDLVEAIVRCLDAPVAGEALNVGAARFGTVREDLEELIGHARSGSRLLPVPARPAEIALRGLELARLSPLAEWHYRTAHKDSFVSIDKARERLGWEPRLSNAETLCATYDWYLAHRDGLAEAGLTHRVPWDQRALGLLKRLA
jgi:nucleoside-diphosphate-sugar epimerase